MPVTCLDVNRQVCLLSVAQTDLSVSVAGGISMTTVADVRPAVRNRRLSRPVAFAAIAAIFVTFTAASAAPSPLYVVYQHLWGFSAITLTVVFAVYVFGLIGSLLVLGALSDHVGRRPVLAAAIALEAV